MCLSRKPARADVGHPDLDRPQSAASEPRAMSADLVARLRRMRSHPVFSVTCNLPWFLRNGVHANVIVERPSQSCAGND
jgi:hypothetical protein